ncbi:glycosyltransferase family 4 protein [Schinkia azotoformans]|uniref:glycosyltransferase family 4 protein n=1 Tax=Schinkia azotoformans TaxID=1454 RepID=UPI002DB9BF55|nr:MraY family glycosyltransferase [Schinkia azotoformans]MEC1715504.1 MraY family glycosyltransferase [Schinkia azotoformans]MEC1741840.1 MraY family glycosyltransferase [Schinkia azotoformans]MEC1745997.1 MraY family glycosyltransferase [Schinkia azotoformans]MEC1757673.1 MraY family glycosyltransferase [Schinkia azotoformans]MEC1766936.1 MraY family glycosyltransferase [Schinkia azotoformans]
MLLITAIVCFLASVALTPLVKKFAIYIGAVDKPNQRKVHQKVMPRLGGLAIFISMVIGFAIAQPFDDDIATWPILLGATIIVITGVFDDRFEISPRVKLLGQILAAGVVIYAGVQVETINLPFGAQIEFGIFTIPFTLLWIVGITNAINLIDGLDGLAAGVSSIVLITISAMAMVMGNTFVVVMGTILLASTLGFLIYNFHPAKIFMGDTGALLLGFMISVFSILGFKSITVYSLILPIIILGVPISDTLFAIIRRIVNKKPLSAPDKSHLHHCLLRLGFSHRQTVLIIYAMSAFFAIAAVMLKNSTLWGATLIIAVVLLMTQLVAERVGLVSENYRPVHKLFRKITASGRRSA